MKFDALGDTNRRERFEDILDDIFESVIKDPSKKEEHIAILVGFISWIRSGSKEDFLTYYNKGDW